MRIIAFRNAQGRPALGVRSGQELVDITALGLPATLDKLLAQGPHGLRAAQQAVATASERLPCRGWRSCHPCSTRPRLSP